MAIINCPECNEKISDTVTQCVHCGSKIIVCPECKAVYINDQQNCSNCGFAFKKEQSHKEETQKTEYKNAKEVYYDWEKTNKMSKIKLDMWLIFAAIGLIIWAVVKLLTWDSVTDLAETSDLRDNIQLLLILAGISYVGSNIYAYFIFTVKRRESFLDWSKSNNVSLPSMITSTIDMDFDAMTLEKALDYISSAEYCLLAEIYKKNFILLSKEKKYRAMSTVLSAVAVVFLYMFLFNNAEIYIQAELFKSDLLGNPGFKFSMMEDWWMLIAGVVFMVLESFVNGFYDKSEKKECEKWINKNAPEYIESYKKW